MWNPDDKTEGGGGKAEAGVYPFKIDDATRTKFRSGNRGAKCVLMVGALPDRDVTVFHNAVFTPAALWKVKELCNSIGYDFSKPIADHEDGTAVLEWVNQTGKARFAVGEKGYLEVEEFLPANASNGPDTAAPDTAATPDDDDVPF